MRACRLLLALVLAGAFCICRAQTSRPSNAPAVPASGASAAPSDGYMSTIDDALRAKNWKTVEAVARQMLQQEPRRWELYAPLGQAQSNLGNFEEALKSLARGISGGLKENAATPEPKRLAAVNAKLGEMYVHQGNAYLKLRRNDEAIAAYAKAAERDPQPARAYFNLCATSYNVGDTEGAIRACQNAVELDPAKADAHFILGSCYFSKSELKDGKIKMPDEGLKALRKYMELAPNGPHAADVKAMLDTMK